MLWILLGMFLTAAQVLATPSPCGQTFNGTDNIITVSASQAGVNASCVFYLVRPQNDKETTMELQATIMKAGSTVTVYVGNFTKDNTSKVLSKYKGKNAVNDVLISTSTVTTVVYKVQKNETGSLQLDYTTKGCMRDVTKQFARIKAPIYLAGTGNVTCTYNVSWVQAGIRRIISFNGFNLPKGALQVKAGNTTVTLSGTTLPDDVMIGNDEDVILNLNINNNNNTQRQSFDAILSQGNADCTKTVAVSNTKPVGLQLPDGQTHPMDCRYILKSPKGTKVVANMWDLVLTGGDDSITFQNGGSEKSPLISRFDSSPAKEKIIVTSGNTLWIRLKLDESVGVRRLVVFVWQQAAGGRYYGKQGNITLKASNVKANNTLYYHIAVPVGQVELKFKDATLNGGTITVRDGQADSPVLATFKEKSEFFTVTGSGSELMVFVDSSLKTKQNFSATFSTVKPGCDKLSTSSDGLYTLTTPQKRMCTWNIQARSQSAIGVIALKVRSVVLCGNSTLTVYDGMTASATKVAAFNKASKSSSLPLIYVHNKNGAKLVLNSVENCTDNSTSAVQASYVFSRQECGSDVSSYHGSIFSPQFPNQYPINARCKWHFRPVDKFLCLSIVNLQLAPAHNLMFDYGTKELKVNLSRYVDQRYLVNVGNNSNMVLDFNSINAKAQGYGVGNAGQGFQVDYKYLRCGGYVGQKGKPGKLINPKVSANTSAECLWIVQLPLPAKKTTTTNIVAFNVTMSKLNSASDNLTIYDGGSLRAMAVKLTKSKKMMTFMSTTNTIVVSYVHTGSKSKIEKKVSPFTFNITYKTYTCKQLCQNGGCLLPTWRCNGKNDCGDNTDELNCTGIPTTAKPSPTSSPSPSHAGNKSTGVKSYVVVIVALLCLCLGVVFALVVPALYRRWKYPNYSHLSDLNVTT